MICICNAVIQVAHFIESKRAEKKVSVRSNFILWSFFPEQFTWHFKNRVKQFHNRVHNLNTLDTFHRDEELIWSGTSTWAHLIQTRKGNEKQQEVMLASNLIKPLNEEKTEQKLLQRLLQLKLKKLLSIKLIQSKNN